MGGGTLVTRVTTALAAVLMGASCWATTYTVTTSKDSGAGSLRWAIEQANSHAGADKVICSAGMAGRTIWLATPLPSVTGTTAISGDTNGDGAPDVTLNGAKLPVPDPYVEIPGLDIRASYCTILGLAIVRFCGPAIHLDAVSHCRIASCHLGVNRSGTARLGNHTWVGDILLQDSDDNVIGGTSLDERNVIAASHSATDPGVHNGIKILGGDRNTVTGNYIGLTRDGTQALGAGAGTGITVAQGSIPGFPEGNRIGGTTAGAGNLIGGVYDGVVLSTWVRGSVIGGNRFGLAADGDTLLPIQSTCVLLANGAEGTLIGGTTAAARNVFAGGAEYGVRNHGQGTRIMGNYFGTNGGGTSPRALRVGVIIDEGFLAPETTIGGAANSARNFFAAWHPAGSFGVQVTRPGSTTVIRNNRFGVLPNGDDTTAMVTAVYAEDNSPVLRDNLIANGVLAGVYAWGADANPAVWGNTFRDCERAVYMADEARCRLGNLGNANANDDGGNLFELSNTWFVDNSTPNPIRAEGNDFVTTEAAQIDAKINDRLDDASLGLVDYDPLAGGLSPTGLNGPLVLTGAAALSTRVGAEVAFALSQPAHVTVEVLNVAGRPIATATREAALTAGLSRVAWNGRSQTGTQAPPGRYLVRIIAHGTTGAQASALCAVRLR